MWNAPLPWLWVALVFVGSPVSPGFAEEPVVTVLASGPGAGHHLEWGGRPILLVGDSVTQGWVESGEDLDQEAYVQALATRGINVLHLWTFIGPQAGGDERLGYDAPEILPWKRASDAGWDLEQLNDAYFSRLKRLCRLARDSSIVVILQVFDGWTKCWLS